MKWLWKLVLPHMDPYQFGAMAKVSTVHALVEMCHDWYGETDDCAKKNYIHAVLIDYSKAFDRIHPNILLEKVMQFNIPSFLLHWVADFLFNRTQQVRIGRFLSSTLDIWGTVPQGTKLGVLLFLLMINDLRTDVPTYKYVDDTTLYKISKDPSDSSLQKAVDYVSSWSRANHMKLNTSKTKEMFISFSKPQPNVACITVDGVPLERVDCVTLLGVKLSSTLTWNHHVEHIIKKAQRKLFFLNILRRSKVDPRDIMKIFQSRVRPILEYAAPVWHGGLTKELINALEDQQKRACKIALPDLSYDQALSHLSLKSLDERRKDLCKSFFEKIQGNDDKLNKLLPSVKVSRSTRNHSDFAHYPYPKCHTNRFKGSFIPYALFNCQ